MRTILSTILASLLLAMAFVLPAQAEEATPTSAEYAATQDALRDLWVEHVFWVRNFVVANASGDESRAEVSSGQVVANAKAIAGAIEPFYGKAASDQLLNLLAGHWTAIRDHAVAVGDDEDAAARKATEALTANAKEIAAFLASANPFLPEATLVSLLSTHGAHHVAQNLQIAAKDYDAEAQTWAHMRVHMFTIADALTAALAKQFPEKF